MAVFVSVGQVRKFVLGHPFHRRGAELGIRVPDHPADRHRAGEHARRDAADVFVLLLVLRFVCRVSCVCVCVLFGQKCCVARL